MKGIAVSKNQDEKLSVPSAAGDWALLVVGGQLNHMRDCTPAGWTGKYAGGEDIRSCTVAVKMVADPADTQNVVWKSPDPAHNGRHVAVLMVFDGARSRAWSLVYLGEAPMAGKTDHFLRSQGSCSMT